MGMRKGQQVKAFYILRMLKKKRKEKKGPTEPVLSNFKAN